MSLGQRTQEQFLCYSMFVWGRERGRGGEGERGGRERGRGGEGERGRGGEGRERERVVESMKGDKPYAQ